MRSPSSHALLAKLQAAVKERLARQHEASGMFELSTMRRVAPIAPDTVRDVEPTTIEPCPATRRSGSDRGLYSPCDIIMIRASLESVDPFALAACYH
jgi:hypothetical protein